MRRFARGGESTIRDRRITAREFCARMGWEGMAEGKLQGRKLQGSASAGMLRRDKPKKHQNPSTKRQGGCRSPFLAFLRLFSAFYWERNAESRVGAPGLQGGLPTSVRFGSLQFAWRKGAAVRENGFRDQNWSGLQRSGSVWRALFRGPNRTKSGFARFTVWGGQSGPVLRCKESSARGRTELHARARAVPKLVVVRICPRMPAYARISGGCGGIEDNGGDGIWGGGAGLTFLG
jgi:hypothetical protein